MSTKGLQMEKLFRRIALTPWNIPEHDSYIVGQLALIRTEEDGDLKASQLEEDYSDAEKLFYKREDVRKAKDAKAVEDAKELVKKVVVVKEEVKEVDEITEQENPAIEEFKELKAEEQRDLLDVLGLEGDTSNEDKRVDLYKTSF